MEKYIMVSFPEVQKFSETDKWSECIACQEIDGHPCPYCTYMIPESLYNEVYGK